MSPQLGVVGLLCLAAGWAFGHTVRSGGRRYNESRLDKLIDMVRTGVTAQDHLVETLDRRMRDVEQSAARAEREARLVSTQLGDVQALLDGRSGDNLPDEERKPACASPFDSEVRDGS